MLKRLSPNKWTSLLLIAAMILSVLPPAAGFAAGERITITNLYKAISLVNGKPSAGEDGNILRFTSNPISITASIDSISAGQVPNIYYEITNISTGIVTKDVSNKATLNGSFNIVFNNVFLNEGLNKIVLKLDDGVTVASEPNWAYFTPTMSLQNLKVNGEIWDENKIYPNNPAASTAVNITGNAPNATDVRVQLYGDASPKSLFLNNGQFLATGDDINKLTNADFKFTPGDNFMTLVATDNLKSFTQEKNLIYDNGDPFAFNAQIRGSVKDEIVTANTNKHYLKQDDVDLSSVEVYTLPNKSGDKLILTTDYVVGQEPSTHPTNAGDYYFQADADGTAKQDDGNFYISYLSSSKKLVTDPTVTTPRVSIDALIKNNVNNLNQLEYKYLEVIVGGQTFGPFDMEAYDPATKVTGHYPQFLHEGYSDTHITLLGQSLDEPGLTLEIEGPDGSNPLAPAANLAPAVAKDSFILFELPDGELDSNAVTGGSYSFKLKDANNEIVEQFTMPVSDPTAVVPPLVDTANTVIAGLQEGYAVASQTVNTTTNIAAPDIAKVSIDFFTIDGTPVGTGSGFNWVNAQQFTYNMPLGLLAGDYKFVIRYDGHNLTERYFSIAPAPAPAPAANAIPIAIEINDFTGVAAAATPTYITIFGSNFGTDLSKFTATTRLVDNDAPGSFVDIVPYAVENTRAVFKINDTRALPDSQVFNLEFTLNGTFISVSDAFESVPQPIVAPPGYQGQVVQSTDIQQITSLQALNPSAIPIAITGEVLDDTRLIAKIVREDGTALATGNPTVTVDTPTTGEVLLPIGLTTGYYFLEFFDSSAGNDILIGRQPLAIVDPVWSSLSPNAIPQPQLAGKEITVIGTNLGRAGNRFSLRFVSDSTGNEMANVTATSIIGGAQLKFPVPPGLAVGSYTMTLLYDNAALATSRSFTVSSQATLNENLSRSKDNQYKVFDFNVEVPIGTELSQIVQFKFYNNNTSSKSSSFRFNYFNPNLPYVQELRRKTGTTDTTGTLISDAATSEINELPSTFFVITDDKTNKINIYLGDYTVNSTPDQTIKGPGGYSVITGNKRKWTFTLDNIPNGERKLTIVPSSVNTDPAKSGENTAGRKTYNLAFTNTPYMIVNNIYSGIVIKSESEVTCTAIVGPCISGRLVNVPLTSFGNADTAEAKVEFYVNESLSNTVQLDGADGKFYVALPALPEGKSKISFIIYTRQNGVFVKVTESIYEIFKFSVDAPSFGDISPIEPSQDEIRFKRSANNADSYTTNETTVSFSGKFANASEIKLTVRKTKDDGTTDVIYDRRFSNFTQFDPNNGNPNFFGSINGTTGLFSTNPITLAKSGDTVFEFTITNASNIQITKTITVTREALPYVVISPRLAVNAKGESQANINSNYYEIVIEAEDAVQVTVGKEAAIERKVTVNGVQVKRFYSEVKNLKNGKNVIKFTVLNGETPVNGEFILFNANTSVEGAQYKSLMKSSIKAFDGLMELKFPRGTNFMRNDPNAIDTFITADRELLMGLAYQEDGRLDKYKHPATYDGQTGNPNPTILSDAKFLLLEPTGRFRPASKLFWIDAGTIAQGETDLKSAYTGSGKLPYDSVEFYNRQLKDLVVPTKRAELVLKYDSSIRGDASKYLTVYQFDIYEDHTGVTKGRWKNIGGVVNTSAQTITVPVDRFGYFQVMFMDQSFDDVTSHPWARNNLDTLYAKGYMLPKTPPSLFVPNDPISRGEFATMLVKIFDIPLQYTEEPTFTDVLRVNPLNNGLYDYKYIETAARAGIVRGMSGGRFQPDNAIRRQDAAVMIAKAANLKLATDENKALATLRKQFTDANSIDIYAVPSVEAVFKQKLITGKENTLLEGQTKPTFRFDPTEPITRAEAATIAIAVLKQQKKLPK